MKTLAAYNIKGGVGKTAAAVNLGYLAARDGNRTLLWDLDPQGAASYYYRVKPKIKGGGKGLLKGKSAFEHHLKGTDFDSLDLLPADFSYRHIDTLFGGSKKPTRQIARLLEPLTEQYDYVFLDCPPGVSLLSENILEAADALLVPLIPTTLSLRTFGQLVEFAKKRHLKKGQLMPFFSMVDNRKSLHRAIVEQLPKKNPEMLKTPIPSATDVERMGVARAPVGSFAARSPGALAYERLWAEIQGRLTWDALALVLRQHSGMEQ